VILIEKKYQACVLRGKKRALIALSMAKKTHAAENYLKLSQRTENISKNPTFFARHLSSAIGN